MSTHEERLHNEAITVSVLSIVFYGFVALNSLYYYSKFISIEKANEGVSLGIYYRNNIGQYDEVKKTFFLILTCSCLLEIPTYIGCLINDGPGDCEWNEISFVFTWFLHCIALCGYALCIVIPPVLWSDMINKRDGKLFYSSFPYDNIKQWFRLLLILYWIVFIINIIATMVLDRISDPLYFYNLRSYKICAVMDSILVCLLSIGCLYCGVKLQIYVRKAKLHRSLEMKFLLSLNIILSMIVLSLLGRAVLVIQFASFIPRGYQHPTNYFTFIIVSRWLPDVLCQFCLILTMRTPSSEIAKRTLNPSNNYSDADMKQTLLKNDGDNDDEDHKNNVFSPDDPEGGREMSSTDFFSFFRIISSRKSKQSMRSSKSSNPRKGSKGVEGEGSQNPYIDAMSQVSDKSDSFAISAIESYDGESYRTGSETEPRAQSVDLFQDHDHVTILTNLTANQQHHNNHPHHLRHNTQSHHSHSDEHHDNSTQPHHSSSYSYGNAMSSIDSARVVIGSTPAQNPNRQYSADSPMFSRSVTREINNSDFI